MRWAIASLCAAAACHATGLAATINAAAEAVQPNAACAGPKAAFCDLRVYQVMVESFINGDRTANYNAGYGTSHHRGDLRGVIESLDYIKQIGMNAVWLTPIFDSHAGEPQDRLIGTDPVNLQLDATGYYTRDYFNVDPRFGTMDDARELVDAAHARGLYVFFDGVFGHHKGALTPSPAGRLPVDSLDPSDYGDPAYYPGRVVDYDAPETLAFYQEVATYWIDELGIDGWRLDQAYQTPLDAWRQIDQAVQEASQSRAAAGESWGTLGYMVSEIFSGDARDIVATAYGTDASPALTSAFDFPLRYATVGVLAGEESGSSGRPASTLAEGWAYGARESIYPSHALPNFMIGNHDVPRFGDLLQRAGVAQPEDEAYWARHRLAFMLQGAYSGPITRYYGEEIGDEVPNYAERETVGCAVDGTCDDHVSRSSGKVLGVSIQADELTLPQRRLMQFHADVMAMRDAHPALSHGTRQHLYSDDSLYIDLKTWESEQIVFAMNVSDQREDIDLAQSLFAGEMVGAWDVLSGQWLDFVGDRLVTSLEPLTGRYLLLSSHGPQGDGDFNRDGLVDGVDLIWWQQGRSPDALSASDVDAWQASFGRQAATGTARATVPEPGGAWLGMIVALGYYGKSRRR
ncbi:MAG: hypothetical protein KDA61_08600 [Planctomycetales bacterium]|nr:hypothetical protein [Planctomycetales bacterium]